MGKRRMPEKKKKIVEGKLLMFPQCIGLYPDEGCLEARKDKPGRDCVKENGLKCIHFRTEIASKVTKKNTATTKKKFNITKDQYDNLLKELGD